MNIRIQTLAIGLTMVVGLSMSGMAVAQGMTADAMSSQMGDNPGMMSGGMSGMGGMDHGSMIAEMVQMHNTMHDLLSDEQGQQIEGIVGIEALPAVDPDDHDLHH